MVFFLLPLEFTFIEFSFWLIIRIWNKYTMEFCQQTSPCRLFTKGHFMGELLLCTTSVWTGEDPRFLHVAG